MARNAALGCYVETTPPDTATISTSKALRTKIFLRGGGMLGTHVNPSLYYVSILLLDAYAL